MYKSIEITQILPNAFSIKESIVKVIKGNPGYFLKQQGLSKDILSCLKGN